MLEFVGALRQLFASSVEMQCVRVRLAVADFNFLGATAIVVVAADFGFMSSTDSSENQAVADVPDVTAKLLFTSGRKLARVRERNPPRGKELSLGWPRHLKP